MGSIPVPCIMDLTKLRELGRAPITIHAGRRPLAPVRSQRELDRVLAAPQRRDPVPSISNQDAPRIDFLIRGKGEVALRPMQALALAEAEAARGLLGALAVGEGKTLVSFLIPSLFPEERFLLLMPARLKHQAYAEYLKFKNDFRIRTDIIIASYNDLSSPAFYKLLEEVQPTAIVADECQNLRNTKRTCVRTRRFLKHAKSNPGIMYFFLSGTITSRSIRDYAHLLELAIGNRTPLPRFFSCRNELIEWSEALDICQNPRPIGDLERLIPENIKKRRFMSSHIKARIGYQKRLRYTRGVIISTEGSNDTELVIKYLKTPKSPKIKKALEILNEYWERPDGEELYLAIDKARVSKQLRIGGFYSWVWGKEDPKAISNWIEIRKLFHSELRHAVHNSNRPGLDSPARILQACEKGSYVLSSYDQWKKVRHSVSNPATAWKWVSKRIARKVIAWGKRNVGIIWTDIRAVGKAIASGLNRNKRGDQSARYFGRGKIDEKRISEEKGDQTIVASIQAHGVGRNLQHAFSKNLIVAGLTSAQTIEQLIGRTHRTGQKAKRVEVYVLDVFRHEWEKAIENAKYIEHTTGQKQKLLSAKYES